MPERHDAESPEYPREFQVHDSEFPGLVSYTPAVFGDARGFFLEGYNAERLAKEAGITCAFIQDNHARSMERGTLRGFHFQVPPFDQAKLVWVVRGAVLDVVLDLRKGSPSYGKHAAFILTEKNFTRLFVPRGFAHAYLTLTDEVDFLYKVDNIYSPKHEQGIRWNDPEVGMDWPVRQPILSKKDKSLGALKGFDSPFRFQP